MAVTYHTCGCISVGQAWNGAKCREKHTTRPGETPKPKPDSVQERRKAEARESGRRLKPGRYRLPPDGGEVERVEETP